MNHDSRNYTGKTSYFNTTRSTHPALTRYEEKAVSQEDQILVWFRMYEQTASPSKICKLFHEWPITSVRRAMTNLTNEGELVKTDQQVLGPYRRPEYVWRLADKYNQRELNLVQGEQERI
jgi:hypothetical protein